MATQEDDRKDLEKVDKEINEARKSTSARAGKVDDLNTRLRELRRKNHFRLMLEEVFNDSGRQ